MAKYAAAEAALAAVDAAIQTHGGNGVATEYGLLPVLGPGPAAPHRPGEPGDDPQLRRPAQPGPAPVLLRSRPSMDLHENLIQRVNVGDIAHPHRRARPDQAARSSTATGAGPTPSSTRGSTGSPTGSPAAGYTRGDALGARLGQQRRVPGRLLRLREARRRLRADQPRLAARRGRLRARPLAGPRHRGGDASSSARWARRSRKVPDVADVIVRPGHRRGVPAGSRRPARGRRSTRLLAGDTSRAARSSSTTATR